MSSAREEIVIEPGRSDLHYWRDLWRYRELLFFLAWRDVLVHYKQTAIGVAWAVLRPVFTMAAFSFVFGKIAKLPSDGAPYPLLVFSGLLAWQLFANALAEAGASLVTNSSMVSKVYFPRMLVPASAVAVCVVDFFIALAVFAAFMAWFGRVPDARLLALPLFAVLAALLALGAGLWIAALNVKYRDFRYVVPFMIQLGLFVSPVGYASGIVPDDWRLLYALNPMVGVIDGFRWALLGLPLHVPALWISATWAALLLWSGVAHFRRTERGFADVI